MVDLTRDQDGCLHARLLDAVVGRSGTAYKTWLKNQRDGFTATVEQAALDPFRG
jgi:transposase